MEKNWSATGEVRWEEPDLRSCPEWFQGKIFCLNTNGFSARNFGIGHIFLAETIVTFPVKLFISTHDLIQSIKNQQTFRYIS